jgi:hypothetical protein
VTPTIENTYWVGNRPGRDNVIGRVADLIADDDP